MNADTYSSRCLELQRLEAFEFGALFLLVAGFQVVLFVISLVAGGLWVLG